ncbi:MAG: hypothetical protein VCA36_00105 [Opitutales bacterium]
MNKTRFLSLASLLVCATSLVADTLPEDQQSRHFQAINQHLDLGGVLYGYIDVDGDLDKLMGIGQEFFNAMRIVSPRDLPMPIDFKRILQATGLGAVKGIGASSYKNGDHYRNKIFILAPGEKKGLLKIGGGKSHRFKTWKLASTGADLVMEQDLNAKALYEMVVEIADIVMGEEGRGMIEAQVKQPIIPGMDFTWEKVIQNLDLSISVVVDMQENRLLRIPEAPEPGMKFPLTDAIVVIENLGWLIDFLGPMAREEEDLRIFHELQWEGIEVREELPGDFSIYKPSMMKHLRSGSLVFATRREFADDYFSQKLSLAEDPKFQAAIRGLPQQGNGFYYLSPTLHKTVSGFFKQMPEEAMGGAEMAMVQLALNFLIPGKNGPEASVTANLPEGFLTVANSGSSLKTTFAASAMYGPMFMGYATVLPMMMFANDMGEAFPVEAFEADAIKILEFEDTEPDVIEVQPDRNAKELEQLLQKLEREEQRKAPTVPRGKGD